MAALGQLGTLAAKSSTYRTAPVGKTDQPSFANAVALLLTQLRRISFWTHCKPRRGAWGARPANAGDRASSISIAALRRARRRRRRTCAFRTRACASAPSFWFRWPKSMHASPRCATRCPMAKPGPLLLGAKALPACPKQGTPSLAERVRAIAQFLDGDDAVRVELRVGDDEIEVARRAAKTGAAARASDRAPAAALPPRIDTIKADLVGIFHASRPAPAEGEFVEGDRELGYIEALGIRTPVHSMGAGPRRFDLGLGRGAGRIRTAALRDRASVGPAHVS